MTINLPSLEPIPDNIEDELQHLLKNPGEPALEAWLTELIQNSGHMSTNDDMRWRVFCIVWLAAEFNPDEAWPYLMWLNTNEPKISSHLSEILIEAVDHFGAHLQMAHWQANLQDERLVIFFNDFYVIPAQRKIQPLLANLIAFPTHPTVGIWLQTFCEGTRHNDKAYLRGWRLLATAWYAAAFDSDKGLNYLRDLTGDPFPAADNELLMDTANSINGLPPLTQLIADCPDAELKTFLQDFGHPHLETVAENIFRDPPDYNRLIPAVKQAPQDVALFYHHKTCLEQASIGLKNTALLDLGCGPLAAQTLLLQTSGYNIRGVDLDIPPGYLPLNGARQWFKRNKYARAWKESTAPYYETLAQQANLKLKWGKVKIDLADLTRLKFDDQTFDAVICSNQLQHAPDVAALLAEAARVLKAGGLFLANIQPYASLNGDSPGDSQSNAAVPWGHLRGITSSSKNAFTRPLNKWREQQFKDTLERYFVVEMWRFEIDPLAQTKLTPEIQAELSDFDPEELTRDQILVAAKKR